MATKMTKGTAGMKTAGPSNSYLKKGGTSKMMKGGMMEEGMMKKGGKTKTKMMYGGMKKGGTKKGM